MTPDLDVAVIGAGVAGLATARALSRAGRSVHVFEAADAVGGRMRTIRHEGYLIDTGAEMVPSSGYPHTWRLIRRLGLGPADVPRVEAALALWHRGRPRPHVGRPLGLLTGAGLPWRARLDLLRVQAAAARDRGGFDPEHPELSALGALTVAQWGKRYSPELFDRLIQPLSAGFFGWRAERSAAAPLAAHLAATGSTAGWRTYRAGMDTLARRLAGSQDVTTGQRVAGVIGDRGVARIVVGGRTLTARSAVLAVPAPVAARLHANAPEEDRTYLNACGYAPMLRVSLALDRPMALAPGRRDFVTLIPAAADPVLNAITVDHHKHPGRVPPGRGLVSLLTSPDATGELLSASDEEITGDLTRRAQHYLPGLAAHTLAAFVHRFPHGLPEVAPEAVRLRPAFLARPVSAVDYAGDWVALRPCGEGAVASASLTVPRVLAHHAPSGGAAERFEHKEPNR